MKFQLSHLNNVVIEIGKGQAVVGAGEYGDKHALFIMAVKVPGKIGEVAVGILPTDSLLDGEIVLTFESAAHRDKVKAALFNKVYNET